MLETLPPPLLALAAAMLFGAADAITRVGLRYVDPSTGVVIGVGTSVALFWVASPWFVSAADWQSPAIVLFALVGLFRPFISANLAVRAVQQLGATIASTVASVYPMFAVAAGALLLFEPVTPPVLLGTCSIVAGVVVLSWRGRTPVDWPKVALLLPLGAAFLRAAAIVLVKLGLNVLPNPFMATLVGNTVSIVFAGGLFGLRQWWRPQAVNGLGVLWFFASGVCGALAVYSLNVALQHGQVSVVSPITAASPLFTMLYSVVLFRTDTLSARLLAGVLLVIPGVMLISAFR